MAKVALKVFRHDSQLEISLGPAESNTLQIQTRSVSAQLSKPLSQPQELATQAGVAVAGADVAVVGVLDWETAVFGGAVVNTSSLQTV